MFLNNASPTSNEDNFQPAGKVAGMESGELSRGHSIHISRNGGCTWATPLCKGVLTGLSQLVEEGRCRWLWWTVGTEEESLPLETNRAPFTNSGGQKRRQTSTGSLTGKHFCASSHDLILTSEKRQLHLLQVHWKPWSQPERSYKLSEVSVKDSHPNLGFWSPLKRPRLGLKQKLLKSSMRQH